jgi:hypothetical protein
MAIAQAKYDRAKALDDRRRSALANITPIIAYFSPSEIRNRISNESGLIITSLNGQRDDLSRLDFVKLNERPDYVTVLSTTEDAVTKLQQLRAEIDQVDQLLADFRKLQERINARGQNLLDNQSSSQFKELSESTMFLKRENLPLTADAHKKLVQSQSIFVNLDSTIDAVMDQEEKRQKLAQRMSALDPEVRNFVSNNPNLLHQPPEEMLELLPTFYGTKLALELCQQNSSLFGSGYFGSYGQQLAEVNRRTKLMEDVSIQFLGVSAKDVAALKGADGLNLNNMRAVDLLQANKTQLRQNCDGALAGLSVIFNFNH